VALARSLCLKPELLLLDEPFSALDTFTRSSLQDEVAELIGTQGLTMVLITHDIDEAVAMADRVIVMADNPGRFMGEESVPMEFPRQRRSTEFATVRNRLMKRFEAASGIAPGAGGVTAAPVAVETAEQTGSSHAV
jgi:NitT/TauT family transport system ATP-binding protein